MGEEGKADSLVDMRGDLRTKYIQIRLRQANEDQIKGIVEGGETHHIETEHGQHWQSTAREVRVRKVGAVFTNLIIFSSAMMSPLQSRE
jgi:hypothetical protein